MTGPGAYELLERIANLVRAEERRAGAELGLQPVQLHALAYLSRCNRYSDTPAAVTEYLGVTKGTASQTLRRLQDKGLVRAKSDRDDARRVRLTVTARGKRAVEAAVPPPALRAAFERFDRSAGKVGTLTELLAALQRANSGRPFGVCSTCRHFQRSGTGHTCGLTGEPLSAEDATRICREHEPAG